MLKILLSSLIVCVCVGVAVFAAEPSGVNPAAVAKVKLRATREAGESSDTWVGKMAEYRVDREAVGAQLDQYTNHLAQLEVILATGSDRVALTNAIAALTGTAKTAAQKSLNYEDAKDAKVRQMINDLKVAATNLKQALQDLKRATQAGFDGK